MQTSLADFLNYLGTSWGLLAGITAFFPFFASLTRVAPLPDAAKRPVGVITSVACAFIVYFIFVVWRVTNVFLNGSAGCLLFLCGMMWLGATFFVGSKSMFSLISEDTDTDIDVELNESMLLMVSAVFYILAFTCITGAFSILAAQDIWCGRLGC